MSMNIEINQKLKYKEILLQIETIKSQYQEVLLSFSIFEQDKKILFIKQMKRQIYSLSFDEWRIDKIWNFINDKEITLMDIFTNGQQ